MPIEDLIRIWWFCSVWAALAIGSERGRTFYSGILGMIFWLARQPVNTQYFILNNEWQRHPLMPAGDRRPRSVHENYVARSLGQATEDEALLGKLISFASCLPRAELVALIDHVIEVLTGLDEAADAEQSRREQGAETERSQETAEA